jgi:hypothetical protein
METIKTKPPKIKVKPFKPDPKSNIHPIFQQLLKPFGIK